MKRFIPYILVIAIAGVGVLGPIGQAMAAKSQTALGSQDCFSISSGLNVSACLAQVGNVILSITGSVLWVAGKFFNLSIDLSINKFNQYANMEGIKTAWITIRDIVNLFFIFILLYIAIATILQLSSYGIKDLLVRVIIIALLVNFSLLATKVIIDASNVLAVEFYQKIDPSVVNDENLGISGIFVQGLKLSTVYKSYDTVNPNEQGVKGVPQYTIMGVILGTFGGILVILVASFILFAFGLMFIMRTVSLLFLIILSPLAFLAMALPAMKSLANEWWNKLFKWSFFAPASLFMIYVVAKIISTNSLLEATGATAGEGLLDSIFTGKDVNIIVYYIILIGLMIGSLIIAQRIGAVGSETMMKWGKDAKKWGQGYAGKISKRGAGYLAEKSIDEKSWINRKTGGKFAKTLNIMPGATRGLARVSSWREQQIKEKEKKYAKTYGSYSPAGLAAMAKREKFGATEIGLATIGQGPRITEAKMGAIKKIQKEKQEEAKKKARQAELRRVADDQSQSSTARLAAMKLLGELDVQTELEKTKQELETEKTKASAAKEGESSA